MTFGYGGGGGPHASYQSASSTLDSPASSQTPHSPLRHTRFGNTQRYSDLSETSSYAPSDDIDGDGHRPFSHLTAVGPGARSGLESDYDGSALSAEHAVMSTAAPAWRRSVRQVSLPPALLTVPALPEHPHSAPAQLAGFANRAHHPRRILSSQLRLAAQLDAEAASSASGSSSPK